MRVIGIDPGYDRLGVAITDFRDGREQVVYSTCIESPRSNTLAARYQHLGQILASLITEYRPETLGIETLFFNKNVKTAIAVAQARGVVLYIAESAGCQVVEVSPQQVKVAVTGYGASDKTAVYSMLTHLASGVPLGALDDEYDAIAVAIAARRHQGSPRV
jgi:crossover junction endodeoxyribonuclease RuvC